MGFNKIFKMLLSTVFYLFFAQLAFANNYNYCHQKPYSLILPFSTFAPAESFCSKFYPVPPVTTTTSIQATTTTTTNTVVTVTKREIVKRYVHVRRNGGWPSCSATLKSKGALGSACSCIESPSTTTVSRAPFL